MKKHHLVPIAAAMLLGSAFTAQPTHAAVVTCVAQGTVVTSNGQGILPSSTSSTGEWRSSVAVCSNGGLFVTAVFSMNGACGLSSGSGTISLGGHAHGFTYQSGGTLWMLGANGGSVVGVVNVYPDPTVANNSCAAGTAHAFRWEGVFSSTDDIAH